MKKLFQFFQFLIALLICLFALILPYKIRARYFLMMAEIFHLPVFVFAKLAAFLIQKLNMKRE